jgi:hypothetical protein
MCSASRNTKRVKRMLKVEPTEWLTEVALNNRDRLVRRVWLVYKKYQKKRDSEEIAILRQIIFERNLKYFE